MTSTNDHPSAHARLLSWRAVRERVGISRTTAWRLQNRGAFPAPVQISAGRVGWRQEDVEAWIASLTPRSAPDARSDRAGQNLTRSPAVPQRPSHATPRPRQTASRLSSQQSAFDF